MQNQMILLASYFFVVVNSQLSYGGGYGNHYGYHYNSRPQVSGDGDVRGIRNAIDQDPIDYNSLINLLASSDESARDRIRKGAFNDLRNKLTGQFEKIVASYLMTPSYYYAHQVHSAIFGIDSDESALIDILCLLPERQRESVKHVYAHSYNNFAKDDVAQSTSGEFQKLIIKCAKKERKQKPIYPGDIQRDAQRILNNARSYNRDDDTLISMLGEYNFERIREVSNECDKMTSSSGYLLSFVMDRYPASDFQTAAYRILKYATSPEDYFAERLHSILTEPEVDHSNLIRLVIMDKIVDMNTIIRSFQKNYKKTLEHEINSRISDKHYKDLLLKLINKSKIDSSKYVREPIY